MRESGAPFGWVMAYPQYKPVPVLHSVAPFDMSDPTDVPAVFRGVLAGLEELRAGTGPDDAFYECFGCGPGHPSGLHVRCFSETTGVVSPIVIPARFQGPKGSAQGGIVASYLDEVLGAAAFRTVGRPAVTGELTVRYVTGAPLETPLLGRGRLVTDHGRYVDVEGELTVLDSGRAVATARGRFFPIPAPQLTTSVPM
jgi:acyl-coenzyme A thioesterase PaaI-like protein